MRLKHLVILPVFALLTTPVFAEELTPTRGQTMRQEVQEERQVRERNRCQLIGTKLEQTIKNYESRKDLHTNEYRRLHTRLTVVSANLSAKGVDTTALNTDLATLEQMTIKLSADYQALITNLTNNKTQACTLTVEQIKTNLTNARNQLKEFRGQSKAIHDFIQATIRKDLQALRGVKPTPSDE